QPRRQPQPPPQPGRHPAPRHPRPAPRHPKPAPRKPPMPAPRKPPKPPPRKPPKPPLASAGSGTSNTTPSATPATSASVLVNMGTLPLYDRQHPSVSVPRFDSDQNCPMVLSYPAREVSGEGTMPGDIASKASGVELQPGKVLINCGDDGWPKKRWF